MGIAAVKGPSKGKGSTYRKGFLLCNIVQWMGIDVAFPTLYVDRVLQNVQLEVLIMMETALAIKSKKEYGYRSWEKRSRSRGS